MSEIRFVRVGTIVYTGRHSYAVFTPKARDDGNMIDRQDYRYRAVLDWCTQQFGIGGRRWRQTSGMLGFREDADAVAFRLRWC